MSMNPNIWEVSEDIIFNLVVTDPSTDLGLDGQAGFIDLTIQRLSDNKYWTGSAWSSTKTVLVMLEADSSNQPGRYIYTLPGTGGNVQADKYLGHTKISNPPTIEGDDYEVHVSRSLTPRLYESEPV